MIWKIKEDIPRVTRRNDLILGYIAVIVTVALALQLLSVKL